VGWLGGLGTCVGEAAFGSSDANKKVERSSMDSEPRHIRDSQILLHAVQNLLAVASLEERISCIMKSVQECLAWDRGWLGLVDKENGVLRGMAWFGEHVPPKVVMNVIPLDPSIKNPALFPLFEKKPIIVDDPLNDPRCCDFRDDLAALGTKHFVIVPILVRDEAIGVIGVDRTEDPAGFNSEEVELIGAFAGLAGLAIENARLYDLARGLSLTDDLTGLHNIRFLREQMARELARSRRSEQPLSILMIDVDDLKYVNDRFGHRAGDKLLKRLGQAIGRVIRLSDIVVRYGGDEFVVLLPAATAEGAYEVAKRVAYSIAKLAPIHGELQATVSTGIALYPEDGVTQDELLHAADEAMFRAKKAGGDRICRSASGEVHNPVSRS
jgi:diguanylate cyclase (GGDEF)-like protein